MGEYIIIIIIFLLLAIFSMSLRIVPANQVYIVERLGAFHRLLEPGIHFIFPLVERIRSRVLISEQKIELNYQKRYIKVKYQITDVKKYTYNSKNPLLELEKYVKRTIDYNQELDFQQFNIAMNSLGININSLEIK